MAEPVSTRRSRAGAIIFILIGVAALALGVWQGVATRRFLSRAVPATGHIVAAPGETGAATGAHPLIEFAGPGGRLVRYRQNGMGGRRIGTAVALLYDPAAPADTAIARGFWTMWLPVLGPLALGLAFVAIPLLGGEIELRGGDIDGS